MVIVEFIYKIIISNKHKISYKDWELNVNNWYGHLYIDRRDH